MLKLLPITALDQRFEALYAIYCESIALREQKAKADLAAMVPEPNYRLLLAQDDSSAVGFSIVFVAGGESFCLLEYMAVDKSYRGRGVGSELFEETVGLVYRSHGAVPVLLEVDSNREPSPDQVQRCRRQNFYRRLGCRRVADCAYILPLPGEKAPPEMDLFVYVPGPAPTIRRAKLERWLKLIYRDVYGCSADDRRIAIMLDGVSDPIELV
jgi:ribosomal protein S18 acetylase RimI-like enzyme